MSHRVQSKTIRSMVVSLQRHDLSDGTSTPNAIDVDDEVKGQGNRLTGAVVREPDVGRQHAVNIRVSACSADIARMVLMLPR